jgi:signal transduction histidine kinase
VSPIRATGGAPRALSVNVLDVTGRRATERERRRRVEAELAQHAAEAANRAKAAFVAVLGHELRTPLQAITGFTELLGTLDLPADRRRAALGHIAGASSHILELVDDVLDIATIETGALPLHVQAVDLGVLVGEVVDLLQPLAAGRGIDLFAPAARGLVRADPRRLRQVLINLVTNGVRYGEPGGWVRVDVDVPPGEPGTVRVTDSGPGIAPELIERMFVPFDRLGVEGGPGAGLGMVLARGLTEAMGGRLGVCSAPGRGTTVEIHLLAAPG